VPVKEVHMVAPKPGQLAQAQPAVGADHHERSIALVDHGGEPGHLVGIEETHLLRLDPRRLDAV
jgi:hypothetical protein